MSMYRASIRTVSKRLTVIAGVVPAISIREVFAILIGMAGRRSEALKGEESSQTKSALCLGGMAADGFAYLGWSQSWAGCKQRSWIEQGLIEGNAVILCAQNAGMKKVAER
jgi:hypothetical protein